MPEWYSFEMPHTGTEHILKSDPDQKTLRFPESPEFHATATCGRSIYLREGDLTKHDELLELDLLRGDEEDTLLVPQGWCVTCAKHASKSKVKRILTADTPNND